MSSTLARPSDAPSLAAWWGSLQAPIASFFGVATARAGAQPPGPNAALVPHTRKPLRALAAAGQPERGPCEQALAAGRATGGAVRGGSTYWPCDRLNAFILQMAAHGHCVNAAMMLGHRPYAVQQLAAAQRVPDDTLRTLAAELQAYFDAPAEPAPHAL